jgi:hypothetical protein
LGADFQPPTKTPSEIPDTNRKNRACLLANADLEVLQTAHLIASEGIHSFCGFLL